MIEGHPSPLEMAILTTFHDLYKDSGFPSPKGVQVRRRENTGSGRYVDLVPVESPLLPEGHLDLGGHFIEMAGVPNGLMAVVRVKDHCVDQIEISVYGDAPWSGEEVKWKIV